MAEGGQEEDSGDVMLATATTPTTASSGAAIKRDPDAPLNLKSEVSIFSHIQNINVRKNFCWSEWGLFPPFLYV